MKATFPPTRTEWAEIGPQRAPFPAPEVTSRDPRPAGVVKPGPVFKLEALALSRGWRCSVTYARGWVPHAITGRPLAGPVDSWAVRCERGAERAVAVRVRDSWDAFWVWNDSLPKRVNLLADFECVLQS